MWDVIKKFIIALNKKSIKCDKKNIITLNVRCDKKVYNCSI